MADYFEAGIFAQKQAWHGLGKVHPEAYFSPEVGLAEVPEFASKIDVTPLVARLPDLSEVAVPEQWGLIRRYDKKCLGTGGPQFIQGLCDGERLVDLLRQVLGDNAVRLESLGTLRDGKVMFVTAQLREYEIAGDLQKDYLMAATGVGGIMRTHLSLTNIRPVCWNTVSAACTEASARIKHTKNHEARLIDAGEALAEALQASRQLQATYQAMTARKVSEVEAEQVFRKSIGAKVEGTLSTRTQNNIDLIKKLYESGDDNAERHQGTLYGAFQACTNYANHHVVVRGEFADREEGKLSPDGYASCRPPTLTCRE
jgi:phage/plasmid-like protein (TIGR03299 family)